MQEEFVKKLNKREMKKILKKMPRQNAGAWGRFLGNQPIASRFFMILLRLFVRIFS